MFLIDIAEWCVEALVLAMALFIASCGTFVFMMVCSVSWQAWKISKINKWINKH